MAKYVFPSSIESIKSKDIENSGQPFIHITLYDWKISGKSAQEVSQSGDILAQYFIAIPETTIQEQYNHSWDNVSPIFSGSMSTKLKNALGWVAEKMPMLGGGVDALEFEAGHLLNDFVQQNYKGLDFRQFEFLFNMIPRNLKEAETIKNIMTTFKLYTTPRYNGITVKYPAVVKFKIYSGGNKNTLPLFQSMFCGVQTLGFNYSPSGFMRTFKDGNPVQIHMNLTLKELKRIDNEELLTGVKK